MPLFIVLVLFGLADPFGSLGIVHLEGTSSSSPPPPSVSGGSSRLSSGVDARMKQHDLTDMHHSLIMRHPPSVSPMSGGGLSTQAGSPLSSANAVSPMSSAMKKVRSSNWSPAETQLLLQFRMRDRTKFAMAKRNHGSLWALIAEELVRHGHPDRTGEQCEIKWRNLTKAYKDCKSYNATRPSMPRICPFYHELDRMMNDGLGQDSDLVGITPDSPGTPTRSGTVAGGDGSVPGTPDGIALAGLQAGVTPQQETEHPIRYKKRKISEPQLTDSIIQFLREDADQRKKRDEQLFKQQETIIQLLASLTQQHDLKRS